MKARPLRIAAQALTCERFMRAPPDEEQPQRGADGTQNGSRSALRERADLAAMSAGNKLETKCARVDAQFAARLTPRLVLWSMR